MLRIHLGQCDVGAAVAGPGAELGQPVDRGFVGQNRAVADPFRPGVAQRPGRVEKQPRAMEQIGRVHAQADQPLDQRQRIAEQEPHPLDRPEEVADHREGAPLDLGEVDGRPSGGKHPALDFSRLEVRVDRLIDAYELAGGLQVLDALAEVSVAHRGPLVPRYVLEPILEPPRPRRAAAGRRRGQRPWNQY